MPIRELSGREKEIIDLCALGFTNDGIAHRLGLSLGTVNTYWCRIRMKVGGISRTETTIRVLKQRETLQRDMVDSAIILLPVADLCDLDTVQSVLQFASAKLNFTAWACDVELVILVLEPLVPLTRAGVKWNVGSTVSDLFCKADPSGAAVDAHKAALDGFKTTLQLIGEFQGLELHVEPLLSQGGEISGCRGLMHSA